MTHRQYHHAGESWQHNICLFLLQYPKLKWIKDWVRSPLNKTWMFSSLWDQDTFNTKRTTIVFYSSGHLPWGLQFQGNIPHIYERTQSWPCQWCRKPPPHHLHGGCLCQCTAPSGDTWETEHNYIKREVSKVQTGSQTNHELQFTSIGFNLHRSINSSETPPSSVITAECFCQC